MTPKLRNRVHCRTDNISLGSLSGQKAKANFLPILFYVGTIHCLHKFFFPFTWRGLLQVSKEFGNSHQEPNYLLYLDRI